MRSVDDQHPLTEEEAAELLTFHTVRASNAARATAVSVAQSHGAAAQALAAWLERKRTTWVDALLPVLEEQGPTAADFDHDGGGEGY